MAASAASVFHVHVHVMGEYLLSAFLVSHFIVIITIIITLLLKKLLTREKRIVKPEMQANMSILITTTYKNVANTTATDFF